MLSAGQSFGPYEVRSLIGAGGMGEVYLARDTTLGRDVAIKVLPDAYLSDTDRRARLEREARLLASLNHQNIGAIYGLEEAQGVRALVLELVDGSTLAERIAQGPLAVPEALAIARQIAEALDAAHQRGIIHRDLKPSNIKIRPDGTIKVLDFGLAKSLWDGGSGPDLSKSPTATHGGTREGLILGTAAYMSPEQARGRPLDKQTDIWAFGCVLYEMLTGRAAFMRGTLTDTLAAIVDGEPEWTALPADAPEAARRLLTRCLQKESPRRLHDIADARIEIDDAIANRIDGKPRAAGDRWRREYLAWGVAALFGAVLVADTALRQPMREPLPAPPIARTSVVLPPAEQLTTRDRDYPIALSPDGVRLAYTAARGGREQLYVRKLDELDATALSGTIGASQPFFSPDGQWIAFFAEGTLQKVAAGGSAPLRICDVPGISMGGTWGADDTIVFAVLRSGLFKIAAAGGTPQRLGSAGAAWPEVLPDGKTVLYTSGGAIATIALDGASSHVVAQRSDGKPSDAPAVLGAGSIKEARFLATGHLVYGQDPGIIRAVPFDATTLVLKGAPVSLVDGVYTSSSGGATYFAVSKSGLLAYARESRTRQLSWVDRNGHGTPISEDRERFRMPSLSPDGKRIAVVIDSEVRRSDIWIYDASRGTRTRLTTKGHNLTPLWSPDGSRVTHSGSGVLMSHPADGSGTEHVLAPESIRYPSSWASDGRDLLFYADDPLTLGDLWILASGTARPLLVRPFDDRGAKFSPDGRWITYTSNESGRNEVYVMSYPDLRGKLTISTEGGTNPNWSSDGRELFYRQGPSMMAVAIDTTRGFRTDTPRLLFDASAYAGTGGDMKFDVSRDGKRFLMIRGDDPSASRQIVVVHNWFEELKRLVPITDKK
jgi:eukaryotic-like serine/threonine-protein kinase